MSEWIDVKQAMPAPEVIVRVYQLFEWAVYTGERWFGVDCLGNRRPLMWQPEYWFPVVQIAEPMLPKAGEPGKERTSE